MILTVIFGGIGAIVLFSFILFSCGFVSVGEKEVGIVVKKFGKPLPDGQIVALKGEAGYQAATLPPGWHFGLWPWQYSVEKVPMIQVEQGQIALIQAEDGAVMPQAQLLGNPVDCDNFQNARKFLENGGQKGRQLALLPAGYYRINTALFTVITSKNCQKYGLQPRQLMVTFIPADTVGIVTTLVGQPLPQGRIAGKAVSGHDNFQSPQAFLKNGGFKGLSEEVILSGAYTLNPWFCAVEEVEMVEVPIGNVGVIVSSSGDDDNDVSGEGFTHSNLVNKGSRGIVAQPLYPGRHPINTKTMSLQLVPTTNVVLNWGHESASHKLDEKLSSIKVRAKDGFDFNLDVSQIIHVAAKDAPKVISRVGSMNNLVENVLEPIIGNYFRNAAQNSDILDFIKNRAERQREAAQFIKDALAKYDVVGVDTLIGDLVPPASLMKTLTDRKIAQEEKTTFETQEQAEKQRQSYLKEKAVAEAQAEQVKASQSVIIAESSAQKRVKEMQGEAEAIKMKASAEAESTKIRALAEASATEANGMAQAKAYTAAVQALGQSNYSAMEMIKTMANNKMKVVPETLVSGNDSAGGGLLTLLLSQLVSKKKDQAQEKGESKEKAS